MSMWRNSQTLYILTIFFSFSIARDVSLNKVLHMSTIRGNLTEANKYCAAIHGRLISLLTENQDSEMRIFLGINDGTTVLTSGFRNNSEWFWTVVNEAVPMSHFNWKSGQPYGSNDCLAARGKGPQYGWYSVPCSNKLPFICDIVREIK